MKPNELSSVEVLPRLPALYGPENEAMPTELAGAKIINIGTVDRETAKRTGIEGGGLVIDFKSPKYKRVRRIVLSFNEAAMWVVYMGSRGRTIQA
jgi:hypothetical protein